MIANYNTPRQTVISGLRGALGDAVSKIRGRKIPLNVSFAAHSPYVAAAGEKMRGVLDAVEFRAPEVPIVSAIDGSVLTTADAARDALKNQMVAPVRWVRVVETLAKMRVEEWVELGGGGVLTRMLKDFELPSPQGHHLRGPPRPPAPAGAEPPAAQRGRVAVSPSCQVLGYRSSMRDPRTSARKRSQVLGFRGTKPFLARKRPGFAPRPKSLTAESCRRR